MKDYLGIAAIVCAMSLFFAVPFAATQWTEVRTAEIKLERDALFEANQIKRRELAIKEAELRIRELELTSSFVTKYGEVYESARPLIRSK
ncbi:hypothetical protein [Vibrio phage vB_VhaP_PG11]|nr:hypothetical protein [Vibrio phage vB_VhaP_PG11]